MKTDGYPCRILKGDRISIPKVIMDLLKLKQGDLMLVKIGKKSLFMKPCKVVEVEISEVTNI